MPGVSGFDVAKKIRELEANLEPRLYIYIYALISLTSTYNREKAFTAGVNNFLIKPAKLKDLQTVIGQWRSSVIDM